MTTMHWSAPARLNPPEPEKVSTYSLSKVVIPFDDKLPKIAILCDIYKLAKMANLYLALICVRSDANFVHLTFICQQSDSVDWSECFLQICSEHMEIPINSEMCKDLDDQIGGSCSFSEDYADSASILDVRYDGELPDNLLEIEIPIIDFKKNDSKIDVTFELHYKKKSVGVFFFAHSFFFEKKE